MTRVPVAFASTVLFALLTGAPELRSQQRADETAQAANIAGICLEAHPHSGPPMRIKVVPAGDQIEVWASYRGTFGDRPFAKAMLENGSWTWGGAQTCAPQWRSRGYDYTFPATYSFELHVSDAPLNGKHAPALLFVRVVEWNAPCGGHPIGTDREERTLFRQ